MQRMAHERAAIECPRCGYDQRGVLATWIEQCPMEATCAECGLKFAWCELLNPDLFPPKWCVEAKRSWWGFPWQTVRTTMRLFWPALVWRRVQMFHETRWRRLCAFLCLWMLVLAVLLMFSTGLAAWAHGRAMIAGTGTTAPSRSAWGTFWHAASQPLSTSATTFVWSAPTGPGANLTSSGISPVRTVTMRGNSPREWLLNQIERVGPPLALLLAIPACAALAFAALPISRRRAKVRWSHIARVTLYLYGMALPLTILILLSHAIARVDAFTDLFIMPAIEALTLAAVVLFWPWMTLFWASAAGSYLRMEHRWPVALSVVVIGSLLPVAVCGAIWMQIAHEVG
jgi:hypothetical protein